LNVAVIRFPGSNCDLDVVHALQNIKGLNSNLVWHESEKIGGFDAAILPGGFSFGDCLRAGAIAARSPALIQVRRMAEEGKPVLGICNGFQILVEAGLLPGSLLRNTTLRFVCRWITVRVENATTPFTRLTKKGQRLRMPIAHNEGRFFASERDVRSLEGEGRVVFRYVDDNGRENEEGNPNGSLDNIAGISNEAGNVVAMMPHPERASDKILSPFRSNDGRLIFTSLLRSSGGMAAG